MKQNLYAFLQTYVDLNLSFTFLQNLSLLIYIYCGGVKPRPVIQAQEHRFIKSTPEKGESLRPVVGNGGARKCPRRLVREEHPPRIWRLLERGTSALL